MSWTEGATFCRAADGTWAPKPPAWVLEGARVEIHNCVRPSPIDTLPDAMRVTPEEFQKARERVRTHHQTTRVLLQCANGWGGAAADAAERQRLKKAADAANWQSQALTAFLRERSKLREAAAKPPASPGTAATRGAFKEGVHYERILPPLRPEADVELFISLACRECTGAQQAFEAFRKSNATLTFAYTPVMWGVHEKRGIDFDVYGKAQLVGLLAGDPWHDRVWGRMRASSTRLESDDDIRNLYLGLGMPAADIDRTLGSFALQTRLAKAREASNRARIISAPTYIVRGRYRVPQYFAVGDEMRANPAPLLDVVSHLLAIDAQ